MSGDVFFRRVGESRDEEESWDTSRAGLWWLMRFIAERVGDPVAAARLAKSVDQELGWLDFGSYTDDEVREMVRVIRDDLPPVVEVEWPPPDEYGAGANFRELIEQTTRWARAHGLL
ncbi:hypothetical protein ABTZ99_31860 [Actinosynnema sp. NPDC002837]